MLIVNCAARTTTVWTNLCLAAALLGLTTANRGLATLAVCLAAYQSMYPIILIFPLAIHLATVEGLSLLLLTKSIVPKAFKLIDLSK